MAQSGGHGPPTLSTPVPRSAHTACVTPAATWMTSPASNSWRVPLVRSSTVPRPDRITIVSSERAWPADEHGRQCGLEPVRGARVDVDHGAGAERGPLAGRQVQDRGGAVDHV